MGCENTGFLPAIDAKKLSADWSSIYKEICAIQQAILSAIDNHSFETTVNGNSPFTSIQGIYSVNVLDGGSGYVDQVIGESDVTIVDTGGGSGAGAVLIPMVDQTTGEVTGFDISEPGADYDIDNYNITITSSFGQDFDGKVSGVDITGAITEITITEGGSGYYIPPDVVIEAVDPMGTGTGATFEANLTECNSISSISVITSGSGYSQATTISITSDTGSGAIAVPKIYFTELDTTKYWAVWSEQITDRQIQFQLEYVTKYFQDLGYQIQIQTNPSTENTIQWFISW